MRAVERLDPQITRVSDLALLRLEYLPLKLRLLRDEFGPHFAA